MRRKKNKPSFRRRIFAVGVVFLFVVLIIASFFGKRGLIEIYRAKKRRDALTMDVHRLEQSKLKLERDIEELKKNPRAIEKKAREKLMMVKPDEIVILKEKKTT